MQATWVNGTATDQINIADRGLGYGDGVFETIEVIGGYPQRLPQHLSRLAYGLARLGFPDQVASQVESDLAQLPLCGDQTVKVIVTRGEGLRGYAPPQTVSATRIITVAERALNTAKMEKGVVARVCDYRLPLNPALAQLKHLNRLDQVMARAEWQDPNISEGVMLDAEGFVVEGTMSNLFWYDPEKGEVQTPLIDRCGVKGVMRDHLIGLLKRESISVVEGRFLPSVLMQANDLFMCNSLIGLWPIVTLDNKHYDVGPITRLLQSILQREIDCE